MPEKEYIEREAVYKQLVVVKDVEKEDFDFLEIVDAVEDIPAADVVPVRHGAWVTPTIIGGQGFDIPHCSACKGIPCGVDKNTRFCPNCGAKMDGGADNV